MQNLVLSVQNVVPISQLGVASSTVSFFCTLGGAVGVSALGALLGNQVSRHIQTGLMHLGLPAATSGDSAQIPDLARLPLPVRHVVENSYGIAAGDVFLVAAPVAFLAFLAVASITEVPLRTSNALPVGADTKPSPLGHS